MAIEYFNIKNWEDLQHYKDRAPPWIKLYNHLLDDYEFACLQDASKLHLVLIWLLASRNSNRLPFNDKWIQQRIGVDSKVDLQALLDSGFIVLESSKDGAHQLPEQDASKMLDDCKQAATTEERESRGEREQRQSKDKAKSKRFVSPTVEEVSQYWTEYARMYPGNEAQRFIDFYESKGWMVGKTKMKDWKAAVRGWINRSKGNNHGQSNQSRPTGKQSLIDRVKANCEEFATGSEREVTGRVLDQDG